ncbi:hypothetical protein CDAR_441491 [Caerostris darwini]|uniref:Uncharacterized protein n=1 Tax=Caerostris darwini TaxID=1538125 RepID=A0AAV4NPY3_9ARAC|nr:hypothetical protein CDAR_441491 [Caerostris darwini]
MVSASHTLPPTTIFNASPIPSAGLNVPFFLGKKNPHLFSIGLPYRSKAIFILLGWTLQPTVIIRELFCPHFLDFGVNKPTLFLATSRQKEYLFCFLCSTLEYQRRCYDEGLSRENFWN